MNRKHLEIPIEDYEAAAKATGKIEPVEIFREMVRIVESRNIEAVTKPKPVSEKDYWATRKAKASALQTELHLEREIAEMTQDEVDKITGRSKESVVFALPERLYCYNCHKSDHWPSQCPELR